MAYYDLGHNFVGFLIISTRKGNSNSVGKEVGLWRVQKSVNSRRAYPYFPRIIGFSHSTEVNIYRTGQL